LYINLNPYKLVSAIAKKGGERVNALTINKCYKDG
jgi:hypothetical protein